MNNRLNKILNRIVGATTEMPNVDTQTEDTITNIPAPIKGGPTSGRCCEQIIMAHQVHKPQAPEVMGDCGLPMGALYAGPDECTDNQSCINADGLLSRFFKDKTCSETTYNDDGWFTACTAPMYQSGDAPAPCSLEHLACKPSAPSCQACVDSMGDYGHPAVVMCGAAGGICHSSSYVFRSACLVAGTC